MMFGQGAIGQLALGQPEDEFPPVVEPVVGEAEFQVEMAVGSAEFQIRLDGSAEFHVEPAGLADFAWTESANVEMEIRQ